MASVKTRKAILQQCQVTRYLNRSIIVTIGLTCISLSRKLIVDGPSFFAVSADISIYRPGKSNHPDSIYPDYCKGIGFIKRKIIIYGLQ